MNSYPSEVYKRMAELYQALADGKKVVLRDADKVEQTVTALHPDQAHLYHVKIPENHARKAASMEVWISRLGYRVDCIKGTLPYGTNHIEGWVRLPYLDYDAVVVDPADVVG